MVEFVTPEAARERFRVLADQVDAAHAEMRALSSDEVGNEFRAEFVERLETQDRTNRGLMYRAFGEIADPPDEIAMAPVVVNSLAARLRVPPREIKRRMKVAGRIRPRRQLCGPPLAPELPTWRKPSKPGRSAKIICGSSARPSTCCPPTSQRSTATTSNTAS